MRVHTKNDFEKMDLFKLETEKKRIFKKIIKDSEARKHRNILYELLGVLEGKKRLDGIPLELKVA